MLAASVTSVLRSQVTVTGHNEIRTQVIVIMVEALQNSRYDAVGVIYEISYH